MAEFAPPTCVEFVADAGKTMTVVEGFRVTPKGKMKTQAFFRHTQQFGVELHGSSSRHLKMVVVFQDGVLVKTNTRPFDRDLRQ